MSWSWQFPKKKVVNKRCESGPIRMSFVVDRKVFVDQELCTTAWSKQWRRVWGFIVSKSGPFSFAIGLWDFHEVFDRPNASEKRQRWESSPAESLCEIYVRAGFEIAVQFKSYGVAWKSPTFTMDSEWHGWPAKFTLIPLWHIFGCFEMKYVRVNRLCENAWRRTYTITHNALPCRARPVQQLVLICYLCMSSVFLPHPWAAYWK